MIYLDVETEAIVGNPIAHPPIMHGIAYDVPGHPPGYLHFRTERANAKYSEVGDFLRQIWNSGEEICFHYAPFDLAVIEREFNLPMPAWNRIHDTLYLCYLADPYAQSLSLKPSADYYLGMPAEEQDELTSWIVRNIPEATRKTAGGYIVWAPFELISKYATGDVVRTRGLFEHLHPKVPRDAYDRERHLMPSLFKASKRGIRTNRQGLEELLEASTSAQNAADDRVRATLAAPTLEVSDGSALIYALEKSGIVGENDWVRTPTGEKSTAKDNLEAVIPNKELVSLLKYRSSLTTCIERTNTWLELSAFDGRLHPEWNQVRTNENGKRYGTRTGRISCSNPNLTNVPNEFEQEIPEGLPPLPFMRRYLLPEEGHLWLKRDFCGQELRIAAHFEEGPLLAAYQENPELDPHQMAKEMIHQLCHKDFARKHVKITGFQIIYGGGAPAISSNVGCSYSEAVEFKEAYFIAMPGIKELSRDTSHRGRTGQAITTWGGRSYYREISRKFPNRDFSYKLLNYLIQGSAADQTKQAIIDWEESRYPGSIFLTQVYDEINISAPIDEWKDHMEHLRFVMEQPRLDCPMKTDGFVGANWHDIEKCE